MVWPTRPYPQITTWSRRLALSALISSSFASSLGLRCRRIAMCGAARNSNGVTSIEQNVAASSSPPKLSGISRFCCIWAIKAKQNSPPWANARPLRHAVSLSLPRPLTSSAMTQPLISSNPRVIVKISKPWLANSFTSISMPMLTKNTPSRISRKGRRSASIWCR
ncbi:hypothetical protein D3C87_1267440 [compost metagenome]